MNAGDDDDVWLRGGAPSQVVPAQSSCLPLAVGLEEPHSHQLVPTASLPRPRFRCGVKWP